MEAIQKNFNIFDLTPTALKRPFDTRSKELPLVSIIVLNWNGEKVIRSCLDSIRKLDYCNIEVIVVDNGSTDTSLSIIRKEFRDFRLIENRRNLGFSAGMNTGIRESHGDLILLFNNDAVAHSECLSKMVQTILSRSQMGMVGGLILFNEPHDVIWSLGGKVDLFTGTIWSDGLGQKISCRGQLKEKLLTNIDYLSGCVLLIKKDVFNKIGLLDEESIIGGQDLDLCLKARRRGFECVLDPSALIWHIGSYASRQMPLRSYAERQKSDFRIILLHYPLVALLSALLFQLVVTPFLEAILFREPDTSSSARLSARLRGFSGNLENLGELAKQRRDIARLGVLRLKIRTLELWKFAVHRIRTPEYYMGRFLQKLE